MQINIFLCVIYVSSEYINPLPKCFLRVLGGRPVKKIFTSPKCSNAEFLNDDGHSHVL